VAEQAGAGVYTHRGTPAVQRMVEYAPGTGGLALWMEHVDDDGLPGSVDAANDGHTVFYGPDFEKLTLAQQTGLVAHQVLHVALRHAQRGVALRRIVGDVDPELYNACADAIVNSSLEHLGWLELPPRAVRLDKLLSRVLGIQQPVEKSLLEWDVERLYRAVDDRGPRGGGGGKGSGRRGRGEGEESSREEQAGGSGERESHDEAQARRGGEAQAQEEDAAGAEQAAQRADGPRAQALRALAADAPQDLLPPQDESPEHQSEAAREWRERLLRAHAGDGAHSMLRELIADLPTVRTPWEKVLRAWLTRGLSPTPSPSWSRPARSWLANRGRSPTGRRLPWEPGTASSRAVARLAVMIDVSGSIDEGLLRRFATEIRAIARRTEAEAVLVVGDDRVRHVQHFPAGECELLPLTVQGGGGTDFAPLLEAADREACDIGVVLTDLDGPAAYKPSFPVVWAVPVASREFAEPFGRRVELE
jgi:hypothetical protein